MRDIPLSCELDINDRRSMSNKVLAVLVRAVITFFEAFASSVAAFELADVNKGNLLAAAIGAGALALSVLYNAAKEWLEKLQAADPLPTNGK